MLIDHAIIEVRSGKGGAGCVSFRREKYVAKGGPNGGDGGDGGDVVLVAERGVDTLLDMTGRHHWFAEDGKAGQGSQMHGRNGADCVVQLPPGTLVYDDETGELIVDLAETGQEMVICKGGKGGFGNEHFKSATNQVPRESTPGQPGEERRLRLELKLIADVGLVGKPNAGKSTLLSRISAARPKVADYPFTTLEPNLGIVELPGGRRIVVADIPGLIEGAHTGAGLGHQFLRHVERTRLLVHLIEIEPTDGSDPADNFKTINEELASFSQTLAEKPQVVALSKTDLLTTEGDRETAADLIEQAIGIRPIRISAASGDGINDLLEACWEHLKDEKEPSAGWSV